jgi:hypothetical protein
MSVNKVNSEAREGALGVSENLDTGLRRHDEI